jgi:hypothetical protein
MMIAVVIVIVISIIFIDIVFVDSNTPICAATDSLTNRRDVAARSDNRHRCHLGDENEAAFGIRRDRVAITRLWDGFDKEVGFPADDA